jgi:hypothetical protein
MIFARTVSLGALRDPGLMAMILSGSVLTVSVAEQN